MRIFNRKRKSAAIPREEWLEAKRSVIEAELTELSERITFLNLDLGDIVQLQSSPDAKKFGNTEIPARNQFTNLSDEEIQATYDRKKRPWN